MPVRFARSLIVCLCTSLAWSQQAPPTVPAATTDPIAVMVGRLSLERYKATIKGLTQFGDRRQGTDRNRAAIDWIEAQLKSYGCTNTERIHYAYDQPEPSYRSGRRPADPSVGPGGSRKRGNVFPDTVNTDPMKQPDVKLRELNSQPSTPGPREEVYCTKIGSKHPDQMYILGAHMDGIGWGEAANDDGSGTALVMELARIFSSPDVVTDVSIRFALWNNEETGLNGAKAYVDQRKDLQGIESPAGSGKYPEPRWLGMVQHDMMLYDHGMPHKDGTMSKEQRPEADVNIEYQTTSKFADQAMAMAHKFQLADDKYATDYPANVGPHMTNTDSSPFMDLTPAISLREVERGAQMGSGWDPQHHQPTDVYSFYSDDDFRLGLNAAQTTLGAIAQLSGARLSNTKSTLLLAPSLDAQTATASQPQSNPELKLMFQEDQRVRSGAPLSAEERSRITRTDADRLTAVRQMVANDQLHTAHDYRNAALILQHGQKSDEYLLAHTLAIVGASKGDKTCAWLSAATLDRYLQSIGQPQIYGTQFKPETSSSSQWTQEPYTSNLVTDAVRKELGVQPLDEQKKQFESFNKQAAKQSK